MDLKVKLSELAKRQFEKLDRQEQKLVSNIFKKLSQKEFITSPKIAKVKKCKKSNVFRFSTGYFRIIFKRNLKDKIIEIHSILKKSGNKTYGKFDCPEE